MLFEDDDQYFDANSGNLNYRYETDTGDTRSCGRIRVDPSAISEFNLRQSIICEELPSESKTLSPFNYGVEGVLFYCNEDIFDNLGVSIDIGVMVEEGLIKGNFYDVHYNDIQTDEIGEKVLYFPAKNISLLQRNITVEGVHTQNRHILFYDHIDMKVSKVIGEDDICFKFIPDQMLVEEMIPSEEMIARTI